MPRRAVPFCAGEHYHLYNRGNNRGPIFFERENYLFFLRQARTYLLPVLDVVAYCLMPTHYHLLVQIKTSGACPRGLEGGDALLRLLHQGDEQAL